MPKKKLTIDHLAAATQRGFKDLEERLGGRIDALAVQMDTLTKNVDTLTKQVGRLAQAMQDNFQHIHATLDTIRHDISDLPALREGMRDLERRVERLERKATASR